MVSQSVPVYVSISYLIFTVRGNSPLVPSSQEVTVDAAQGHCNLQMSSAWLQCLAAFLDCSFYFVLLASISHKNFSSLVI